MHPNAKESIAEQLVVLFNLNGEVFALPVNQVREVIKIPEITKVPETADYVEGMITLRGKVISIINLRKRFQLPADDKIQRTAKIIIVENEMQTVGLIVDHVNEVKQINLHEIQPPPQMIEQLANRYVEGVVFVNEKMFILINLKKVFSKDELLALSESSINQDVAS